jgi:hypothetical protein
MRLSEEYVLAKTRAESLREVRNLNLWGNGVSDVSVRAPHANAHARTLAPLRLLTRACGVAAGDAHAQLGGAVPLRQPVRGCRRARTRARARARALSS